MLKSRVHVSKSNDGNQHSPTRVSEFGSVTPTTTSSESTSAATITTGIEATKKLESLLMKPSSLLIKAQKGRKKKKKVAPNRPSQEANISLPTLEETASTSSAEDQFEYREQVPPPRTKGLPPTSTPVCVDDQIDDDDDDEDWKAKDHKEEISRNNERASMAAARGKEKEAIKLYDESLHWMELDIQNLVRSQSKSQDEDMTDFTTEWRSRAAQLAHVRTVMAVLYERLGFYQEAIESCLYAKQVHESFHDATTVAQMDHMLESLERAEKSFAERKGLQEQAIQLRIQVSKTTSEETRQSLMTQTLEVLKRALVMEYKSLGDVHPQVAETLLSIADLYLQQDDFGEAVAHANKSLNILKLSLGPLHPRTCTAMRQMGKVMELTGEIDKAIPLYLQAIEGFKECLDEDDTVVGATLNNVAVLYIQKEEFGLAVAKLSDALQCYEASTENILADSAQVWKNLGECYLRQGEFESAHFAYTSALEVQRDARFQAHSRGQRLEAGFNDASIGDTLLRLGRTTKETMRLDESYAIYREALLIYRMHYRLTKKTTKANIADAKDRLAHTMYCMAEVQEIRDKLDEALKLYGDSLQLRLESDARRHDRMNMVHCAMALQGVGTVHMKRQEFHDATLAFEQAVKYMEAHGVPDSHDIMLTIQTKLDCARSGRPLIGGSVSFSSDDNSTEDQRQQQQADKRDRAVELDETCQRYIDEGDYDAAIKTLAAALVIRRRRLTRRQRKDPQDPSSSSPPVYLQEKEQVATTLSTFALILTKKGESKQACMLIKEAIQMHLTNGLTDDHVFVKTLHQQLEELNI